MQGKLRSYIEELLVGVEESEELQEFKYELVMNLCDKINDLLVDGLTEDEAFREAVATLGDLRAVFAERQGYEVNAAVAHGGVPCADSLAPFAQHISEPKGELLRSKRRGKDYTGALVIFSVAMYLIVGLMGVAGGFRIWWVLPIAAVGLGQLLEKEYPGAILMITLALSCLLVMLKVLSNWWWVLALLTVATGVIVLIED